MKRDCDPVGAVARRQDLLFESLLNPFQAAAESELLKPQRLLLKAGAPACGLLCMADHAGWHAKETAYFLDREGAAFQHLRIFRVNCQLLPLHVTVKQQIGRAPV